MRVKFYGVRGSFPTPSIAAEEFYTDKVGGNTTCLRLVSSSEEEFIIDAGTGLRVLGNQMMKEGKVFKQGYKFSLLLTHEHQDHIEGGVSFKPFYLPQVTCDIYAHDNPRRIEELLRGRQRVEYFPVRYSKEGVEEGAAMASRRTHYNIESKLPGNGIQVSYCHTNHPDGCVAYRFEEHGKVFVFGGDHECSIFPEVDEKLIAFFQGAHVLVMDTQYLPEEREPERFGKKGLAKKGWGHSDYEQVVDLACKVQPEFLLLTHHDPEHDDKFLNGLWTQAEEYGKKKGLRSRILLATEGLELPV